MLGVRYVGFYVEGRAECTGTKGEDGEPTLSRVDSTPHNLKCISGKRKWTSMKRMLDEGGTSRWTVIEAAPLHLSFMSKRPTPQRAGTPHLSLKNNLKVAFGCPSISSKRARTAGSRELVVGTAARAKLPQARAKLTMHVLLMVSCTANWQ